MDVADFTAEYKTKADEELLKIHYDAAELTEEARLALSNEMRARSLDKPGLVETFRKEEQRRQKDEMLASAVIRDWRKIGRTRFGKSNYEYDGETGIETFTTTLFLDIFLPLIPTGTYRVEKKKGWRYDYKILEKLPLDWQQVLQRSLINAVIISVMIVMFRELVMK